MDMPCPPEMDDASPAVARYVGELSQELLVLRAALIDVLRYNTQVPRLGADASAALAAVDRAEKVLGWKTKP